MEQLRAAGPAVAGPCSEQPTDPPRPACRPDPRGAAGPALFAAVGSWYRNGLDSAGGPSGLPPPAAGSQAARLPGILTEAQTDVRTVPGFPEQTDVGLVGAAGRGAAAVPVPALAGDALRFHRRRQPGLPVGPGARGRPA